MEEYGTLDDLLRWPLLANLGLDFLNTITRAFMAHTATRASLLIDRDDQVYYLQENRRKPKPVRQLSHLNIRAFTMSMVSPGRSLKFALKNGELYGWAMDYKQLGAAPGTDCDNTHSLTRVTILGDRKVDRIVCGVEHTVALTEDGEVWAWGRDVADITSDQQPWQIPKCSDIAAGHGTSVALTEDGDVHVRGSNDHGQLGCQRTNARSHIVSLDRPVVRVAMGLHHVLALTDDGRVIAWGKNERGQIGNNRPGENVSTPRLVKWKDGNMAVRLVDIVAILDTSFAISSDGTVYIWGSLGAGVGAAAQSIPMSTGLQNMNEVLAKYVYGTHKTLVIRRNNVIHNLEQAFDNESLCDCYFEVEGRKIYVQKLLLKARSPYFRTMFDGAWEESSGEITIAGHSYTAYRALLRHLCTGSYEIDDADLLSLLQLAHETMNENLIELCVKKLRFKLAVQNILDVFAVAKVLELKTLLGYCKQFTNIHLREIIEKQMGENPELFMELLKFAAAK